MRQITAILSFSGTRMAYVLERNRDKENPGEIDYPDYLDYSLGKIKDIVTYYFEAGGQNLILEVLDVGLMTDDRGEQYADLATQYIYELADGLNKFYREIEADVTFIGIDAIQHLPTGHPAQKLGKYLNDFNNQWQYDYNNRHQILWNIAAIPLYTIHQASQSSGFSQINMEKITKVEADYYENFAQQIYGFNCPMPDLYISSNTNGDFTINSRLPLTLGLNYHFRLFYVPFPTFFMTQDHFNTIMLDMEAKLIYNSYAIDYGGQISQDTAKRGYEYYKAMAKSGENISGLFTRSI